MAVSPPSTIRSTWVEEKCYVFFFLHFYCNAVLDKYLCPFGQPVLLEEGFSTLHALDPLLLGGLLADPGKDTVLRSSIHDVTVLE